MAVQQRIHRYRRQSRSSGVMTSGQAEWGVSTTCAGTIKEFWELFQAKGYLAYITTSAQATAEGAVTCPLQTALERGCWH